MFWTLISWFGLVIFCYRNFLCSAFHMKFLSSRNNSPSDKKVEKRFMFIEQNHILSMFRFEFLVWSSNGIDVIIGEQKNNIFFLFWLFVTMSHYDLQNEKDTVLELSFVKTHLLFVSMRQILAFSGIAYRWTSLVFFVSSIIVKFFKAQNLDKIQIEIMKANKTTPRSTDHKTKRSNEIVNINASTKNSTFLFPLLLSKVVRET